MQSRKFSGPLVGAGLMLCASTVFATDVRITNYNIEADINGVTTPRAGLTTVLEAMGEAQGTAIAAHPLDIIGLEETTSNATTVAPIVTALNSYYGSTAVYAQSTVQGTESGGDATDGNGPNAIVYNSSTLALLNSTGVGTPTGSTNGEYRQVMRYEFQPVGGKASQDFYVYVSHTKSSASGTTSADQTARNQEAVIIRNDEAALPSTSSVLYMGDFNLDGSTEAAYQTLTGSGNGQGVDPQNASNNYNETWHSSTYAPIETDSVSTLGYRDDIQFMTSNIYNGTSTALNYVAGSSRAFGNNGSIGEGGGVTDSSNTALTGLAGSITASQAYSALNTGSDHYPVEADYTIASVPEPATGGMIAVGLLATRRRRRR